MAGHVAFTVRHGRREGRGDRGGRDRPLVGAVAGLAALGLRPTGRQREEENEEEEEEGDGRAQERHGGGGFPREVGVKCGSADEEVRLWDGEAG